MAEDEANTLRHIALLYSGEARRAYVEAEESGRDLSDLDALLPDEDGVLPYDLAKLPPAAVLEHFGHLHDWTPLLSDVERFFGQYQADVAALYGTKEDKAGKKMPVWLARFRRMLAPHASSSDEIKDLEAIVDHAQGVLALLELGADVGDARACLAPADRLRIRLNVMHFPPRVATQLTEDPAQAIAFEEARERLALTVHRVALWPLYRISHIRDLRTVLAACEGVLRVGLIVPAWSRVAAREEFKRRLRKLYRPDWDVDRRAEWRERIASGETLPPPRSRDEAFAEAILEALAIPREARPRKG